MKHIVVLCSAFLLSIGLADAQPADPTTLQRNSRVQALGLNQRAKALLDAGRYTEADQALLQGLSLCDGPLNGDPLCVAAFAELLGDLRRKQGRLSEAEQFYTRSLAARRQALAADDPAIAESLLRVAGVRRQLKNYAGAEETITEAVERFRDRSDRIEA